MKNLKVMMITLIMCLVSMTSCNKVDDVHQYSYEVSGTSGDYNVTLEASPSGTEQYSNVGNDWWYKWEQTGNNPRFLYISAQNQNDFGTVIVKIIRDGITIATNSSSGAYVIATSSGSY